MPIEERIKTQKYVLRKVAPSTNNVQQPPVSTKSSKKNAPVEVEKQDQNNKQNLEGLYKSFVDSDWYCFEREGFKLSRKILRFKHYDEASKTVITTLEDSPEKKIKTWTGEMRLIEGGEFMVATLYHSDDADKRTSYTHFVIQLDNRVTDIELAVGHKTFKQGQNNNVVTKTVIIEKINHKEGIKVEAVQLSPKDADKYICSFFEDRSKNRLSSPHARIFNKAELITWIKDNIEESRIHDSILGHYDLYYHINNDEGLTKESITLERTLKGVIAISYRRPLLENLVWIGRAIENMETRTLTVTLAGPFEEANGNFYSEDPGNEPIFLMLNVPTYTTTGINTLTGLIAGVRDNFQGTVARLALLVKSGKESPGDFSMKYIEEFFQQFAERSRVRPPHGDSSIWRFSDLKKVVEKKKNQK